MIYRSKLHFHWTTVHPETPVEDFQPHPTGLNQMCLKIQYLVVKISTMSNLLCPLHSKYHVLQKHWIFQKFLLNFFSVHFSFVSFDIRAIIFEVCNNKESWVAVFFFLCFGPCELVDVGTVGVVSAFDVVGL